MDNPTEPAPAIDPFAKLWTCDLDNHGCGKMIGYIVCVDGLSMLKIQHEDGDTDTVDFDIHTCGECGHTTIFYRDARAREWRQRALERKYNPKRGG